MSLRRMSPAEMAELLAVVQRLRTITAIARLLPVMALLWELQRRR